MKFKIIATVIVIIILAVSILIGTSMRNSEDNTPVADPTVGLGQ